MEMSWNYCGMSSLCHPSDGAGANKACPLLGNQPGLSFLLGRGGSMVVDQGFVLAGSRIGVGVRSKSKRTQPLQPGTRSRKTQEA